MDALLNRKCTCWWLAIALAIGLLTTRTHHADDGKNPYPGRFPAPSLDGGVEWLNTSGPISLQDLRGKVVLLDFWTYCCINCIHILPDLKYLEDKYQNELVVIGVHAAKFENEKLTENIREAVLRYEIEHPVVNDANFTIARKYFFNSWPTLVVIDPEGQFVGRTSGEGNRELLDRVIGELVKFHKKKGTLDETPIRFDLERASVDPTPLRYPGKLVVDEPGNRVFISDSNHNRIVIASLDGKLLDIVGSGQIGATDGSYSRAEFDHPQGMVLVGENLYVADTENHLLRVVNLQEKTVSTLAGTGKQASFRPRGGALLRTPLNSPWALTELNGTLYIAMAGPHQLWRHRLGARTVEIFAGNAREHVTDGPLEQASLAQPSGITHDGEALYFVDSEGSAVRKATIGPRGTVTTIAGPHDIDRALFEFGDIDGVGDAARLQHPLGIVHREGKLYIADTYNHKIRLVDIASREVSSWLGTGERGAGLDPVQLNEPAGLALSKDTLWIADTNNHRILKANLQTKAVQEFQVEGLTPPPPPQIRETPSLPDAQAVEAQSVASGKNLTFTVDFALPEDFKLNKLASVICQVDAVGEQALVPADQLGIKHEAQQAETRATLALPLAGTGTGTFDLTVQYQYCRDGEGGVCRFGTARLRVPVTVTDDATQSTVQLKVATD